MSDALSDRIASKRRTVMIKFKSMDQIIQEHAAWFDGHGNLHVHNPYGASEHMTPNTFHWLGKMRKMTSHHTLPAWCIEAEWDDLFAANMALRAISSGKMDPEDAVGLAQRAVLA